MRSFTDTFIKHPVLAVVVNLVIVLVGWRAITTLPVQQYPNIQSSSVLITTVYYGAGAEPFGGSLPTPIERVVRAISGVDYVESTSRAGVSSITVHLKLNHNSTAALAEVTARLQQVRSELPAEAEPPVVEVQRADRPYASFYLSFTSSDREIPQLTDWLTRNMQPQLTALAGAQGVDVVGGRPIAMRIWIDPDRLAALNLAPGDVHAALQRNNYLAAVGQTKGDLVQVNLLANTDLRTTDEFKNLVVAERNGALVRLSDVARVELGAEEATFITKFSDKEAVYLGVWPLVGSNEIEVANRLHAEMARIRPTLPNDIDMQLAYDATVFMTDALHEISKTLAETILIVGLVVFLFMGSVRTALVPLVAMPVSLVGAAVVMYAFGFSLNLLTILAIVLSVGLVVDDAIVVVENVERHVREGKTRIQAALVGALGMRWAIVAAAVLVMLAAWPLYQNSRRELAPVEDQSHISLFMAASPDASLEATNKASLQVVKAVTSFPEAKFMWSLTANWGGFGGMVAKNWKERKRTTKQMFGQVYDAGWSVSGLQVFPRLDPPLPTPGQYDVELLLTSDVPPEQMLQTVGAVLGAGWQSGKFLYVDTDLKMDLPEARVVIDRDQVADLGLDLASVGRELGTLLGGGYVNRFNYFDRSYKVIPQIGDERRTTVGPLLDLKIKTPSGRLVPVSTFTHIESSTAPRTLNRFQQRNAVRIFGGVKPGVTKEEGLRVLENAAKAVTGPGVGLDYAGESRQIRLEGAAPTGTLGFAVILIYLVLAAQFRSFRDPLIVLVGSVPLAISGALVFSYLDFTTINIYSQVGLITLVGLIAKNGILIVQFANTLQSQGAAKLAALREASLTRLRPVLMTSAATVFGHLPLVFATGPGPAARNSIGPVLGPGMTVGTTFPPLVGPVFYSFIAAEHRPETEAESEGLVLEPALVEGAANAERDRLLLSGVLCARRMR